VDWIDEIVDYFRKKIKTLSLKEALGIYILIAVIGVVICYISTFIICGSWINLIYSKYNIDYMDMSDRIQIYRITPSSKDRNLINIIRFIESVSVLVYSVGAILITSHFYYKNKLEEPLYLLKEQTKYISRDDLSYICHYESDDEMGEVCKAFDKMRVRLVENQRNIWSLMEEQRSINAAFAHDLRTPLTVIQGYNEFLIKYYSEGKIGEEKLHEILELTNNQVKRLINFSETMKDLHTFEEILVDRKKKDPIILVESVKEIAKGLKEINRSPIHIQSNISSGESYYDERIILEVIDNLISNAIRYAKSKIEISIEKEEDRLLIYIRDDGRGFTKEELYMASKPYYSDRSIASKHFGIGLTICKILCEKHGGTLHFSNSIHGGAIVCAEFFVM
jgi:signal transduction histidine kinase